MSLDLCVQSNWPLAVRAKRLGVIYSTNNARQNLSRFGMMFFFNKTFLLRKIRTDSILKRFAKSSKFWNQYPSPEYDCEGATTPDNC